MLEWIISVAVAVACLGAIYSSFIERHWTQVRPVNITLADLPRSFSGLKIALFSDTHLGFYYQPKHLSSLIHRIHQLNPDVICFTGDLLDSPSSLGVLEESIQLLSTLQAPHGKFAVVGNHDYNAGIKETLHGLRKGGFTVLQNEHVTLTRDGEYLSFIGLDDTLDGRPNLTRAFENTPPTGCNVLLVHEPDFALQPSSIPISLQLSGHSHGGQVRIPFWGPIVTTRLGSRYVAGINHSENGIVYTTRGIGTTHLPIRFCCRPELTLIILESEKAP